MDGLDGLLQLEVGNDNIDVDSVLQELGLRHALKAQADAAAWVLQAPKRWWGFGRVRFHP